MCNNKYELHLCMLCILLLHWLWREKLRFPTNSNITVLDNTDKYLSFLKQSVSEKRDDLTVSNLVINSAENMTSIESNSMDVVLHTFLLCSIADYNAAINEVYRVLK